MDNTSRRINLDTGEPMLTSEQVLGTGIFRACVLFFTVTYKGTDYPMARYITDDGRLYLSLYLADTCLVDMPREDAHQLMTDINKALYEWWDKNG